MDFLTEQRILYTSKKYEDIYSYFNEGSMKLKIHEIFLLCASIGFKNNRKNTFTEIGKEFRTNYFSTQQMSAMYSIILNDSSLGKQVEMFYNNGFKRDALKRMEEYAEGGMEIICEEIFKKRWNGKELSRDYDEYDIDILSYIYENSKEIPF